MRKWTDRRQYFLEFEDHTFTRDNMSEEREKEWVEFCYEAYESDGFAETFGTPYNGERKYLGMKFEVLGRVPFIDDDSENGADLECLPMWKIKLENGDMMAAYPEEICLTEKDEVMA